jgi:GNAT superfamily N-acetyltransferase
LSLPESAVDYRRATPADAGLLASLNRQLIRDEGHRNAMSVAELEARMAGWLAGEYEAVLFEDAGQTFGYALFRREPDFVYVRQFFVRPESRRQGVGRGALTWLAAHIWAGQRLRLDVLTGNAAGIAFWRALGFQDLTLEREP